MNSVTDSNSLYNRAEENKKKQRRVSKKSSDRSGGIYKSLVV